MAQPLIEGYEFGKMVVGGKSYVRDLIITPGRIISPWWRREGHLLAMDDLREVADADVECIVIGTGYDGLMHVSDEVISYFRGRGVKVYIADTRRAVKIYNELVRKGVRAVGVFHLTC